MVGSKRIEWNIRVFRPVVGHGKRFYFRNADGVCPSVTLTPGRREVKLESSVFIPSSVTLF